ncbi:hypothetical protein [Piscinibacter sp. HJYY11]|uniref:hypothetical protein n=1 Tax=Piscinibacter sp. HJYY11 TaxID=2801333 RepID=UPI00191ECA45|nr:hypothetical protein [Piscinibacter sp. HJYY11]MBL0729674.1 hypothetical protein [Piscinibacter sp. HJYY11]
MLQLLVEQLTKLSHSGFFADDLDVYVKHLCANVQALQNKLTEQGSDLLLISQVVDSVWRATQFLAGTTSNKVPYEFTYLLREVLVDWQLGDTIVTTSLHQAPDFTCQPADMAPNVLLKGLGMEQLSEQGQLVQMGMPEIFQHMPLLCTPLYHEVGHFVEARYKIVKGLLTSQYDKAIELLPDIKVFNDKSRRESAVLAHITEHFCDLVAASYVGACVSDYIIQWDRNPSFRETHPSADSRAEVTQAFLRGVSNPIVDMLKEAVELSGVTLRLAPRYEMPDVATCFNDVRPMTVKSIAQLHGLLPAADEYLKTILDEDASLMGHNIASVPRAKRARLVNDLVEKSIRSFMITKAWHEPLDQSAAS